MRSLALSTLVVVSALTALAQPVGAATIGSAPLFSFTAVNLQCGIANITSKPVTILSAKIISGAGGDLTNANTCVGTLQPGTSCAFNTQDGATNQAPYAVVKLAGSAKAVRGACALFNGSTQTLVTPMS